MWEKVGYRDTSALKISLYIIDRSVIHIKISAQWKLDESSIHIFWRVY